MSVSTGNNFVEVDFSIQKIAIVKINRPEAKNALNGEVRKQLAQAFTELSFNDEINAVVLTGGEEVFAAGADLKEMATATSTEMLLRHTERYWNAIAQCPKPVIAAVNGYALGGGCELAMHADIIIAGKGATFGQPEIKVGLMPGAGGTQRLPRAVSKAKAMDLCLTARMMDAAEAERAGLVSRIVAADKILEETMAVAKTISEMSLPVIMMVKESVNTAYETSLNEGVHFERRLFHSCFATEDQKEGMAAFVEKRPANFKNK